MATILKGKLKGKTATINKWSDDWFSVTVDGVPKVVQPTALQFTKEEMLKIFRRGNNGVLFELFEPTEECRFKRKKI